MFDAIIKTLIPILKNQKYNKKKEKNSLILRLYDIGSNIIKGLIDLYSNYYNPYTGNDELEIFIQDIIDKNLFIFNDILNNVIDLDIIERGTDFFDNNWEDYTYDDIVHFCYKKDQKTIKDLNAGFIIVLANSAYFGFKKENELQLILEEEKNNIGTFNLSLIYNNESYYIASTQITEEELKTKSRRDQILSIINDIIIEFIRNTTLNDGENKGRQDLDNFKTVDGYYITNGKAIKIKCRKTAIGVQTQYVDLDENEIDVNDGNTWINICPIDSEVVFE